MDKQTREYIHQVFQRYSLEQIIQDISSAFYQGLFNNPRQKYYHQYALSLPLDDFIKQYLEAWSIHDKLSNQLLNDITRINNLSVKEKISTIRPLLVVALENDARVSGFTGSLNDNWGLEGIFSKLSASLSDLIKKSGGQDELIYLFFSPYNFSSFQVEIAHEFSLVAQMLPPEFLEQIYSSNIDKQYIESEQNSLQEIADKYTYGDVSQLFPVIRSLGKITPNAHLDIAERKQNNKVKFEQAKQSLLEKLNADDQVIFLNTLEKIQTLLYFENYEEPRRRFNVLGGFGDYLLRELTARMLFDVNLLRTPNPMKVEQIQLASKLDQLEDLITHG